MHEAFINVFLQDEMPHQDGGPISIGGTPNQNPKLKSSPIPR